MPLDDEIHNAGHTATHLMVTHIHCVSKKRQWRTTL